MTQVQVVVVGCACGTFPLEQAMHANAIDAWRAAAAHVELTSHNGVAQCTPEMFRDTVPAALAPAGRRTR